MKNLIILNSLKSWDREIPGAELVTARDYLLKAEYGTLRNVRVFNLCKSFSYQSIGYYVSLLAAARGHKPLPSIATLVDIRNVSLVRYVSDDLDALIQKSFRQIQANAFTLSIYFGKNLAKRHDQLSKALFNVFTVPFIRANFRRSDKWHLTSIHPMSFGDIPPEHMDFAMQRTQDYFARRSPKTATRRPPRYNMAILYNPDDPTKPSDDRAIDKFKDAAEDSDMSVEIIEKQDYGRLSEFDALFIRETTGVNHHTFRFARKAQAEDIVVVDHPDSILKCTNKVFLAELLSRHELPAPKTMVLHSRNKDKVLTELGLPIILKQPDSTFSLGVVKVETPEEFHAKVTTLLHESDLVIAQEFLPTEYDWRIGVLSGQPLFACKYFMARKHWQIARHGSTGNISYGKVEAVPVEQVPAKILTSALKAARLIGDGLYGVDMKQAGDKGYVIEVNENPNVEAGVEDGIIKDELYTKVIDYFLQRLERRTLGNNGR